MIDKPCNYIIPVRAFRGRQHGVHAHKLCKRIRYGKMLLGVGVGEERAKAPCNLVFHGGAGHVVAPGGVGRVEIHFHAGTFAFAVGFLGSVWVSVVWRPDASSVLWRRLAPEMKRGVIFIVL